MSLGRVHQQEGPMVRLLGYTTRIGIDTDEGPKEIRKTPSPSGDNGWLIRFFDSAFFCEWIAVSYLYKHEHSGVRDYLCNRMYTLPLTGIENYLFQLCYMLLHKPSPALDKYIVDMCGKSLRIAIKVHWFLMAEAEDVDDSQEISRMQERCQMAVLMGDWPPLIRPPKNVISPGARSRMFKLISSRRLLPLTSYPPPQRAPPPIPSPTAADDGFQEASRSPLEEMESSLKALKKFMPGTKVRDAIFKKFREKEKEEKEEKEEEDGSGERTVKDADTDNFFKRLFRDKDDDEKGVRSDELANSEGFFRRLFRDKSDVEDRIGGNEDEKEGFFRKLFRDKGDDEEKGNVSCEEEDGSEFFLFRKFFRVHPEEALGAMVGQESTAVTTPENSPGSENFFKRLFRDRSLEDGSKFFSVRRDGDAPVTPSTTPSGFLRRLFKDRSDEEAGPLADEMGALPLSRDSTEGLSGGDFLQESLRGLTLFPGKNGFEEAENPAKTASFVRPTDTTAAEQLGTDVNFLGTKGFDDTEWSDAADFTRKDSTGAGEKAFLDYGNRKAPSSPDTSMFDIGRSFNKRPGSPKKRTEKLSAKPPLPKYSSFQIRKGVYHATLDFVQALCDTSSGLVDVFPMEDRHQALEESLTELNQHLVAAESDGGVCFPMGKGLYRVLHIPEDEAVLLNSREKAPFLICVEVLKSEHQSQKKEHKESGTGTKLAKGGIPLANGDAQLQRPPPWAFPMWSQPPDIQQPNTQQLLRSASKAIDLAMAHLWEAKLKVVDVSFSVKPKKGCGPEGEQSEHKAGDTEDNPQTGIKELPCRDCNEGETERTTQCSSAVEESGVGRDGRRVNIEESVRLCGNPFPCTIGESQLEKGAPLREDGPGQISASPELCDMSQLDAYLPDSHAGDDWKRTNGMPGGVREQVNDVVDGEEWVTVSLSVVPGVNMEDVEEEQPTRRKEHRRVPSTIAMAEVTAAAAKGEAPPGLPVKKSGTRPSVTEAKERVGVKPTDALAGELWEHKRERIRKASKRGTNPDWDLRSMIVKSGDDCRQEHLAVQLVSHFYDIFQEAGLPLWLRPYEVLVTSSHTALIETIYDTASIHAIKNRNANLSSLRDFFCKKYEEGSPSFKLAQRNFVESMAGYSILCYFLQVKDRHNGNLLLDEDGHIIHIDFGFMLSNSPGGVNFESAPFKLTRELLEVMDSDAEGTTSEFFDYFKVLCIQGFLTCRKHAERIILLVQMMQDSGCPCFKGGPRTIQNLRKRFHLSLTEEQCVSLVLSLISSSLDAWRTRQYDYYQRVLNGIL